MADIFIAVLIVSGLLGVSKPKYGAIAGAIIAPLAYYLSHSFNWIIFIILFPAGLLAGFIFGSLSNWFFSGFRGGRHSTGPTYKGITGRAGGTQRGGIILTDEERKNAQENQNQID